MTTVERDDSDFEPWLAAVDPICDAISTLLVAILEGTTEGSPARRRAMSEALEAHRRINDAMRDRRTLN
jgi:hypothetical protein